MIYSPKIIYYVLFPFFSAICSSGCGTVGECTAPDTCDCKDRAIGKYCQTCKKLFYSEVSFLRPPMVLVESGLYSIVNRSHQ